MINHQGKGKKEKEDKFGENTQNKEAKHIGDAFNNKKQIENIDEDKKKQIKEMQKELKDKNDSLCLEWEQVFDGRQF